MGKENCVLHFMLTDKSDCKVLFEEDCESRRWKSCEEEEQFGT